MFDRDLLRRPAPKFVHKMFGGESLYGWSPKIKVWDDGIYLSFDPFRYGYQQRYQQGYRFENKQHVLDDAWTINLRKKEKMFPVLEREGSGCGLH